MASFEEDNVLLYVGALYDSYPLTISMLRKNHKTIVFTDGLPASQYYKNLTTEKQILDILLQEGGLYAFVDTEFILNEEDGSYEAMLKDNCKFKYFFNTNNIDTTKIPNSLLQRVTTLYIHGYQPPVEDVVKIPNVSMVYCSASCVGETYWKVRSMMDTVDDNEKLIQYNMRCLIPDVLRWIPDVGFDLRGVEWLQQILFECDAPYQFIIDDDDDDEYDEEDDDVGEDDDVEYEDNANMDG
jgi:hypothetical protein